ncbi:hypothetical protein [Planococcus sp. 4-30]|uniref:hypothetical protein n=1 Tax=Planococcus sp. 4-30 TaxID=2874583 RepID=UPI001CBA9DC7|nr:hypothetical protein [Planococcus sp. 4-30]
MERIEKKFSIVFSAEQSPCDVLAYIRSITRGKKSSFIGFYNNRYLLTVDDDEFIVISRSPEDLIDVQNFIREMNGEESK